MVIGLHNGTVRYTVCMITVKIRADQASKCYVQNCTYPLLWRQMRQSSVRAQLPPCIICIGSDFWKLPFLSSFFSSPFPLPSFMPILSPYPRLQRLGVRLAPQWVRATNDIWCILGWNNASDKNSFSAYHEIIIIKWPIVNTKIQQLDIEWILWQLYRKYRLQTNVCRVYSATRWYDIINCHCSANVLWRTSLCSWWIRAQCSALQVNSVMYMHDGCWI